MTFCGRLTFAGKNISTCRKAAAYMTEGAKNNFRATTNIYFSFFLPPNYVPDVRKVSGIV
jgi:hypothetical protein